MVGNIVKARFYQYYCDMPDTNPLPLANSKISTDDVPESNKADQAPQAAKSRVASFKTSTDIDSSNKAEHAPPAAKPRVAYSKTSTDLSPSNKAEHAPPAAKPRVAYFSMEFGIDDSLPIFAGGLGVLAGDVLLEAAEQNQPFIGIGLLYRQGYKEEYPLPSNQPTNGLVNLEPEKAGLTLVKTPDGQTIYLKVQIADRQITVQAWQKNLGTVTLYLLDTVVEGNSADDQNILDQLYVGDKEHRLKQEVVLGIGGVRLLQALGITPAYYHLNEAHCALVILELLNQAKLKLGQNYTFQTAENEVRQSLVFTNHTIVPAGNDMFSEDLITIYLERLTRHLEIPIHEFWKLGKAIDASMFSMTLFALRFAKKVNAVSFAHARVANERWPGFTFIPITNGVCRSRWLAPEIASCWPLTKDPACTPNDFWQGHLKCKRLLLAEVKNRSGANMQEEALTITWARRITEYKRPLVLFHQLDRLKALLHRGDRPLQILMAGRVHPHDTDGKEIIKYLHSLAQESDFAGKFQFIPNYDLKLARLLVSGSDIWLNTPLQGYEACGTSGMKACLNGVLQMTTKDGWTDDIEWESLGWTLNSERVSDDIYRLLETDVANLYFDRGGQEYSAAWVERMQRSSQLIRHRYSTARMLADYYQKLYV